GTAAFTDAGAKADAGVFENGNGAEEKAGEQSDGDSEQQNICIDADFSESRNATGSKSDERAEGDPGEAKPQQATEQSEGDAFIEDVARNASAAGAESGTKSEFLAATLDAHEKEVGNVGASDQKDQANRAH